MSAQDPRPLIVTKESAAKAQLESAVWIWFHYGDPVSTLQLASAAHDCYWAMGGHAGKQSAYKKWLKAQSQADQDRIRYVQNFIKHGRKDLTKKAMLMPGLAEVLMADSVVCHEHLFSRATPLMRLYLSRFGLENPLIVKAGERTKFLKSAQVQKFDSLNRIDYLKKILPGLLSRGSFTDASYGPLHGRPP